MNAKEAILLTRYVKGAFPAQKFDEYTPDIWADVFAETAYADAMTAARTLVTQQTFISAADILTEVRRIRADRLTRYGRNEPEYDGHDVAGGLEAIREHNRRVAAGEIVEPPRQLSNGPRSEDVEKLLDKTMGRLPRVPSMSAAEIRREGETA